MEIRHFEIKFGTLFFVSKILKQGGQNWGARGATGPHKFPRFDKVMVRLSSEAAEGLLLLAPQMFLNSFCKLC